MSGVRFGFTAKEIIKEGRVKDEDISQVKNWIITQNVPKLTDEQIVLFLLACYNKQNETQATIKAFYSMRCGAPQLFNNRNLEREDIQEQLKVCEFCVLPERTDDDYAIFFARAYDTVYYHYNMEPGMKIIFMSLDAAIYDRPPNGMLILFDMKGVGLMHLTRIKLHAVKVFCQYLQEGLPTKLHAVHVLNSVYFIDKVMAILRPFIKADVLDKIHFHSPNINMEEFYEKWIPKRCLPEEYGGDLPTVCALHEDNVRKLTEMQPHFEAEELQRQGLK